MGIARAVPESPGHALSKQTIANSIHDSESTIAPNTVEVYVSRLRASSSPRIVIRTVRGLVTCGAA
jgi:DNA-binding response OmpR family regulator